MKLIIPLPPSDNNRLMYSPTAKRLISTPKYRKWSASTGLILDAWVIANQWEMLKPSYHAQYEFDVNIYHDHHLQDIGNFHKAIKDVLTGRIYDDDRFVSLHQRLPMTCVSNRGSVIIHLDYKVYTHE